MTAPGCGCRKPASVALSRGPAGASPTEARCRRRLVLDAQSRPRRDKPDGGPILKTVGPGCSVAAPPGQARRRPDAEGAWSWMLSRGPAGTSPTEARCRRRLVLDAQWRPRRDKPDGGPILKTVGPGCSVAAPPGQARRRPDPQDGRCWTLSRGPAGTGPTEARLTRRRTTVGLPPRNATGASALRELDPPGSVVSVVLLGPFSRTRSPPPYADRTRLSALGAILLSSGASRSYTPTVAAGSGVWTGCRERRRSR